MKISKSASKNWGFDVHSLDRAVRPQDDFYQYANGRWLAKNAIPPTESRWGSFIVLRYRTEHQLKAILEGLRGKKYKRGTPEQLIADLYQSAIDFKERNRRGMKPLLPLLEAVRALKTKEELLALLPQLHCLGISAPWAFYVDQDSKDSNTCMLTFVQAGLSLPDRDYYLKEDESFRNLRKEFRKYMARMYELSGIPMALVPGKIETLMNMETKIARFSMPKEDARDAEKTYHKKTVSDLAREVPALNWAFYLKAIGADTKRPVIVAQPGFFKGASRVLASSPLEHWKTYLEWHLLNESASLLSSALVQANFDFYGTVMTGSKKMKPVWRRGLSTVNAVLGEALGKRYIERHFKNQSKRAMDLLVSDLFAVYEARISTLSWMGKATKKRAIEKLRAMGRKIGYPTKWERYKDLVIRSDDFFGNLERATLWSHKKEMARLRKPVERHRWFMSPQTVNAYCHQNLNEIVFPAGILQHPFFDVSADEAVNYGAIGSVIGHEMTHGFDDQGSKFDKRGNLKRWWTPEDYKRFQKKGAALVKQFDAYEVLPGLKANGKLTLGENIADLGGLAIAYDAYQRRLKKTGRKMIAGFTPEQRFFLGFAQQERQLAREAFIRMMTAVDAHSHADHRVNGPLSNFTPFYEAFGVKPGDKLFRKEKDRVVMW